MISFGDFRKKIKTLTSLVKGENQVEMTGVGGLQNFVFPFGEQLSAKKHNDVSVQFQYNYLDTEFDVKIFTDGVGATVGASDSLGFASTTVLGETAHISSIDAIRYRAGHSGFIDFTLGADTTSGSVYAGGFDVNLQNGFAVEIIADVLTFGFFKNGVKLGSDFNSGFDAVDTTGINLSFQNVYRIVYGFLGVKNPVLFISIDGIWKKLKEVQTEGRANSTHTSTPVFPITVMALDGASCYTGSWNGGVIGNGSSVGNRGFHFPLELLGAAPLQASAPLVGSTVKTIVAFRSKDIYQGKINSVKASLLQYTFLVYVPTGNIFGEVEFQVVGVTSYTGTPVWKDVNTVSSVMQYDHVNGVGSALVPTSGKVIAHGVVPYLGSARGGEAGRVTVNAEEIAAFAYAGGIFAVIAKGRDGDNVTVKAHLVWEELF